MEFNEIKCLLSRTRCAVDEYSMIDSGDRIAVGLSGRKDSIALLCTLLDLKRFYPKKFDICAITVSMGFKEMDYSAVSDFCLRCGVEYRIVETQLAHVVFDERKEKNPCSICSKMRHGILHNTAQSMGCNKIALGHHFDDEVETFLLNLFNGGRLKAFLPVTYLSRKNITMIRPFIYVSEEEIRQFVIKNSLPQVINQCPEDGKSEREKMKIMIKHLEQKYKGLKGRIFKAIKNGGLLEYHDK